MQEGLTLWAAREVGGQQDYLGCLDCQILPSCSLLLNASNILALFVQTEIDSQISADVYNASDGLPPLWYTTSLASYPDFPRF